jgi:hypothetical protein
VVAALVVALLVGLFGKPRPGVASTASAATAPSATVSPIPFSSLALASPSASASDLDQTPKQVPSPTATSERPGWHTLGELLTLLRVAAESRTGYNRDLFPHWIDADGDGCNTRYEVLIEEAILAPTVGAFCTLTDGTWKSLYDGLVLTDAANLQIDHLVALAEAWDSGASAWTTSRRMLFANDLDVPWELIAVSGASNEAKADSDPADWLPSDPGAVCPFISAYIAVKARWELSVDQGEKSALSTLILKCPGARMPLVPAPAAGPTPVRAASGVCDPAYPTVCIPPPPPDLDCAEIAYRRFTVLAPDPHRFDGDHNGIGCESG